MTDNLLRPADVAAEYGISTGTLKSWRALTRRGTPTGPASFNAGQRRVVYRRSVVEAWIAEQEQAAAS